MHTLFVSDVMKAIGEVKPGSKAIGHRVAFSSQDVVYIFVVLLASFSTINVGHLGDSLESPFFCAKI